MTPDVSILVPFIDSARFRVGQRRTDPADVARILAEFGAHCAAAENTVEAAIAAGYPSPAFDTRAYAAIGPLFAEAYAQIGPAGNTRGYGDSAMRDAWARLDAALAAVPGMAETERRQEAIREACAVWWFANACAIDVLCLRAAHRLLAGREVTA